VNLDNHRGAELDQNQISAGKKWLAFAKTEQAARAGQTQGFE
jgi:hypothetical protein